MGFPIVHELICPTVGIEWICYPKFGIIRLMDKNSTQENPVIRGSCVIHSHNGMVELKALVMRDASDDLKPSEFDAVKHHLHNADLAIKIRRLKRDGRVRVTEYYSNYRTQHYYEDK